MARHIIKSVTKEIEDALPKTVRLNALTQCFSVRLNSKGCWEEKIRRICMSENRGC